MDTSSLVKGYNKMLGAVIVNIDVVVCNIDVDSVPVAMIAASLRMITSPSYA